MIRLPEETVSERFMPTARAMIARDLDDRGMTQDEIARELGVSQAAVSKYVSRDADLDPLFSSNGRMVETVEEIGEGLYHDEIDGYDAVSRLLRLVREFENRGPICEAHEDEMPSLRGRGCDLCVSERNPGERQAVSKVKAGARILSETDGVADYIPNVGTNVVTAVPGADTVDEVVGVPGRVYEVRGEVKIPAKPELGASENVSEVVLAAHQSLIDMPVNQRLTDANSVEPSVRGGLNLATSDDFLEAAENRGVETVEFDPAYENRRDRLSRIFEDSGVPEVVYHTGGFGIEPITYVLGETAVEAAELASEIIGSTED
ncbi:MAG: thiamine-phosphate synthase family protein [Halobacteria archaeon]|nr:thiamine-phosphate synthase family protein [Halobacteria archaeon]